MKHITYTFTAKIWEHAPTGGWHFVSLPVDMSKEIRSHLQHEEEGWGRLKAIAIVGTTEWQTAIWFDTKKNAYLLPIKSQIRKKEKLFADSIVQVTVKL